MGDLLKKFDFSTKLDDMFGNQCYEIIYGFATSYGFYTRGMNDTTPSAFNEGCFDSSLNLPLIIPLCVDHDPSTRIGWIESISSINLGVAFRARIYNFPALFDLRPKGGFSFSIGVKHGEQDFIRTDKGELILKAIISEISLLTKNNPADIFSGEIIENNK